MSTHSYCPICGGTTCTEHFVIFKTEKFPNYTRTRFDTLEQIFNTFKIDFMMLQGFQILKYKWKRVLLFFDWLDTDVLDVAKEHQLWLYRVGGEKYFESKSQLTKI